jgi:hypothetical protein
MAVLSQTTQKPFEISRRSEGDPVHIAKRLKAFYGLTKLFHFL